MSERIPHTRIGIGLILMISCAGSAEEAEYAMARTRMVDEVDLYATLARDGGEAALDEEVLKSLGTVRRHEFVPQRQVAYAYEQACAWHKQHPEL